MVRIKDNRVELTKAEREGLDYVGTIAMEKVNDSMDDEDAYIKKIELGVRTIDFILENLK